MMIIALKQTSVLFSVLVAVFLLAACSSAFSSTSNTEAGRRAFLATTASSFTATLFTNNVANAVTDCMSDCEKNCKLIAPKDPEYCRSSCFDYCQQPDRTDGLSGSVSSEGGETGIFGTNTVVKGEDKPPQLKIPGLDFTSANGKKLIGY
ncbi:hypothetical protein ACHAWC_000850 [Mediolabrus comicus]